MIACIQISTGLLIEAHAHVEEPGELIAQIAKRDDIDASDLEEREVSSEELDELLAARIPPLTYAQKRALEYPPMADYLDAIVKGDEAQKQRYIDECLAVKVKYPKPA